MMTLITMQYKNKVKIMENMNKEIFCLLMNLEIFKNYPKTNLKIK